MLHGAAFLCMESDDSASNSKVQKNFWANVCVNIIKSKSNLQNRAENPKLIYPTNL